VASNNMSKRFDKPFDPREHQRYLIEEELERFREALGSDYEAVRGFALRFYVAKEAGSVHLYFHGEERDEAFTIEERAFNQVLDHLLKGLIYETGLASKLESVDRAKRVLGQVLFKVFKSIEVEELYLIRLRPFDERLKYIVERAESLVDSILRASDYGEVEDFKSAKLEVKASVVYRLLEGAFDFVRVWPLEATGSSEYYVLDDNVLREVEEVIEPVVGALVKSATSKKAIASEVEMAIKSTTNFVYWSQVDPWDKLNLKYEVLDLKTLRLTTGHGYYFRYRLDVYLTQEEIDEVRKGAYDVKENEVYKAFRAHFDDENWEYLVHALGTWLAPHRSRHLLFIIGPKGSGKSTLLRALRSPIEPIVASVPLRLLTEYTFGLEGLIGKQLNVYSERGEVALKSIDVINNLVGEHDFIAVPRKFKPTTTIRSLKAMAFAMNDPPIIYEYGGETMAAFLDRLSIVFMRAPEGFKPIPNFKVDEREAFKFLLWCRCRLEEDNWEVRKMDEEAMLDYLMEASNTALRFLESEWVIKDPSAKVKGSELYDAYVAWCKEKGVTPMGRQGFYSSIARKCTKRVEKSVVWFRGVMINPKARGSIEPLL